jgi:hypothetical protein
MGLLDDAIREHLELKRQHGADPGEVARQEREALGPARGPAEAPSGADDQAGEPAAPAGDEGARVLDRPATEDPIPPPPAAEAADARDLEDTGAGVGTGGGLLDDPAAPPPAGAVSAERFAAEPEIDWSEPPPLDDPEPPAAATAEDDADVLEATPEFLEETPEHDRLWFEQRPPRDFDF